MFKVRFYTGISDPSQTGVSCRSKTGFSNPYKTGLSYHFKTHHYERKKKLILDGAHSLTWFMSLVCVYKMHISRSN